MKPTIIVIGSSNTDMVLKTQRFPKPGETILGGDFFMFQGGKGANQAVAAARLGGTVTFICKVGEDLFGDNAINHYAKENINVHHILKAENTPTGVALITVNAEGENEIVVASGANALLSPKDVESAQEILSTAAYFLTQLETPLSTVEYLAKYANTRQKKLVLNPAPAAAIPSSIYEGLFLITPNETEAELLTGTIVTNEETAKQAAETLQSKGVVNIIITMGSKGAYVHARDFKGMVKAQKVIAVDTTAAGDVFNGALVVALAENKSWEEAVAFGCRAAAISVTKMGAQSSAPYRNQIDQQ
ncbi:MAG: ribokinase [Chitinophagaceae bacterium]|nr:ribokinase [Chitinophagaceae bacterium]